MRGPTATSTPGTLALMNTAALEPSGQRGRAGSEALPEQSTCRPVARATMQSRRAGQAARGRAGVGRPNSSLRSLPPVARAALSAQRPPRGSARDVARYSRAGLPHTGHKPRRAAAWLHWAPAPLAGTRAARDQKRVRSSSHAAGLRAWRLACPPPARSPPRASRRRRQSWAKLAKRRRSTEMSPGQLLHAFTASSSRLPGVQPRLYSRDVQPAHAKVAPSVVCLSPPHTPTHEHEHTRRHQTLAGSRATDLRPARPGERSAQRPG